MFTTNKKKTTVVLFLAFFVALGIAAYNPPKEKNSQLTNSRDTLFKNLHILPKDIGKDSLDKVMHGFNDALGVKCFFCHVHEGNDFKAGWKFESDDKPEKNTARYMLKMTAGINTTYFNVDSSSRPDTIRAVTCVTCHRGISHPDAEGIAEQMKMIGGDQHMPPPPPGNQQPPPPPPAPQKK